MKKFFIVIVGIILACSSTLLGCEEATQIKCAYISEITSAGSQNHAVRVTFADDKRFNGKGVDTQIKFDRKGEVTIWKEGGERNNFIVTEKDEWHSMTVLLASFADLVGQEKFELKEKALNKTYIFASDEAINITLRVVAGDIEKNSEEQGEILTGSTPISNNYTLKIK